MKPQQLKQLIREEVRKITKSITKHNLNEGSDLPHLKKVSNEYYVDTPFIQSSNKFGNLVHAGFGDFILKTSDGSVYFTRTSKQMPDFVGRTHTMSGDATAIKKLIASMSSKYDLNEANINWKEFYTMAKDTSGHNPNFEKKYGNLMDRPHIADALKKARDFNSFLKAVKQFEVKESINEGKYDADLDKIEAAVKNASSFMGVGAELKKAGIKYDFSTSMIAMYTVKVPGNTIAIVNKKYVDDAEREVNNIAIGLLEGEIKESSILSLDNRIMADIKKSISMGYNQLVVGMIKPKTKGVMLINKKSQVRGTYPLQYKDVIQSIIDKELGEGVIKESTENFIGAALVKKSGMVKDLDSLEKEPIYVRDVLPIYRKEGSSYVVKSLMTGNALKVPAANLIVKMKDQFEPDKWAKFMAKMTRY